MNIVEDVSMTKKKSSVSLISREKMAWGILLTAFAIFLIFFFASPSEIPNLKPRGDGSISSSADTGDTATMNAIKIKPVVIDNVFFISFLPITDQKSIYSFNYILTSYNNSNQINNMRNPV